MKIQQLLEADAVDLAGGALISGALARGIQNSVQQWMVRRGSATVKQRLAGQAIPGISLALGLVFAYNRYRERPQDYIGMGLDLAAGVAGLASSLALIPVQMARDAYYDVVQDLLKTIKAAGGQTTRPELLQLTGDIERDTVKQPQLVQWLLTSIKNEIAEQIRISMDQVKQWEKLSQPERSAEIQRRADAISPEAGAAQAARAAATDRLRKPVVRPGN